MKRKHDKEGIRKEGKKAVTVLNPSKLMNQTVKKKNNKKKKKKRTKS